jgi:chaperonin GroEL
MNVPIPGTTTATILTRALFEEACKSVAAGCNPEDLRRGMQKATDIVADELKKLSKVVDSKEEIEQVATISANSDIEVGKIIAHGMEKVGKEGVILVQDGKGLDNEIEVVEGMKFDQGFLSHHFVSDKKTMKWEEENVSVLITDTKVAHASQIVPLLEQVLHARKKLLIVAADGLDNDVLTALVLNKRAVGLNVCAVKAPGFGDNRKAILQDLATLTGADLISEELGMKLEEITLKQLGTVKKATVSADDTILLGGSGSKAAVDERCEQIREHLKRATSDYEREKLNDRLAKLGGGVAILKVGGASETEVGEKKDRVVDALNATRAAVEKGIVPGGGTALLYASRALENLKLDNFDQNVGVKIVRKACEAPCRTIVNNAGLEGSLVVATLLDTKNTSNRLGFNAQTGEYVDMLTAGIIDPTKVVHTALVDASRMASLMATTEAMIVDEEKPAAASNMPAGMGGMGGMPQMPMF